MSYTWGYLKDTALAKLDLTEDEAITQNLLSRFPFYANEAMTQICSAVKPKYTFAKFVIEKEQIGVPQEMPDDFVSFGDDVSYELEWKYNWQDDGMQCKKEIHQTDYEYYGNSQVVFKRQGEFYISYNARWFIFTKSFGDGDELKGIPLDVLDCIPSYIASQCFQIDDMYKAQNFRNEYEMMLSRIDNTHYCTPKTFEIMGGW